jgi:large subunit ribosomal protein L16
MPLMPKRVKYRKRQRGRKLRGKAITGSRVVFGEFGLKALATGFITARQIEAGRVAATHFLAREGKVWIRMFPDKPMTAKPLEQRMGKGKADVSHWVCPVKRGQILYEIGGVAKDLAVEAFNRSSHKMPVKTRFVERGRF